MFKGDIVSIDLIRSLSLLFRVLKRRTRKKITASKHYGSEMSHNFHSSRQLFPEAEEFSWVVIRVFSRFQVLMTVFRVQSLSECFLCLNFQ